MRARTQQVIRKCYEALPALLVFVASLVAWELTHLQAAEFLYETRLFPDLEYTFKHALTHEVAYGGLLHDRQRALHACITEAIERLAPERVAEQAERLAHHALRGESWEKAAAYLRQAGHRAMARAANREAIAHLEQALGAVRRLPETRRTTELIIDIHLDVRHALLPLGERARMGEHLHEAEGLARTLGDQHRLGRIATFMVIQFYPTPRRVSKTPLDAASQRVVGWAMETHLRISWTSWSLSRSTLPISIEGIDGERYGSGSFVQCRPES